MFAGIQAKIIAALAAAVGLIATIAGVYFKGRSDKGEDVEIDAANDLLDDIETKQEISNEGRNIIEHGTRDERINRL